VAEQLTDRGFHWSRPRGEEAIDRLLVRLDVVITDLRLGGADGTPCSTRPVRLSRHHRHHRDRYAP